MRIRIGSSRANDPCFRGFAAVRDADGGVVVVPSEPAIASVPVPSAAGPPGSCVGPGLGLGEPAEASGAPADDDAGASVEGKVSGAGPDGSSPRGAGELGSGCSVLNALPARA